MAGPLADGAWRDLGDRDKEQLRDRLREACARAGRPLAPTTTPGDLAARHEPALTVQRAHFAAMDTALVQLRDTPNAALMIWTPSQVGKALALDTPIPTPEGWSAIGDLDVGDRVFDRRGDICHVTWKSPIWTDRECYAVETTDGERIVASGEHEWLARLDLRSAEQIHETKVLARKRGKKAQIASNRPLNLPDADLPIHPYILGYWLGDGSKNTSNITTYDDWVVERIRELGYRCEPLAAHRAFKISTYCECCRIETPLRTRLKELGVARDKRIPSQYLRASEEQRLELLRGLIDSDGYVDNIRYGAVEFCNANLNLAQGVRELVYSLGSKATLKTGRATLYGSDCGPKYRVHFRMKTAATLPRKAAYATDSTVSLTRYVFAHQVGTVPTQCIEVDSPDHTYLAGRTMLPTHNSVRVSRWFPFWWLTQHPRDRIILGSYASRLAESHAAACRDLIAAYGGEHGLYLRPDEATRADWSLTTGGGMRARGVGAGLVGNPMDLGVIDDPYRDRAAADSPVIRDNVWDWYSSAWVSRRSPHAREVLVMHRWHPDDLAGRLLQREGRAEEGGRWQVLHLPALALHPDPAKGIYPDPLGRAPGDPLTHPKIPEHDRDALLAHWLRMQEGMTARDWSALGLGVPFTATGALLDDDAIRDRTGLPGPVKRAAVGVDPSGGGRDTAGVIGGHLDTSGRLWWTHSRTARMSAETWSREACLLAREIDADVVVIETNYGGDQATTLVRQAWAQLQAEGEIPARALCPRVQGVHSRKNKLLRAEPIAQAVITGRAWFGPHLSLRDLRTEWTMWEPGSSWSPGALDAAVHLAWALLPPLPGGSHVTSVAGRRRDEVRASSGIAARRAR